MKRCFGKATITALGVGIFAGLVLPEKWITVVAVVLLIITLLITRRC